MVAHMVKIILSLALLLCGMPAAVAVEQCEESACISVYTDNNQIIIEAHKGSTTVKKTITPVSYTHLTLPTILRV